MHTCGLILLAGGSSSRLQQPKQALSYQGTTLLQHSLQTALSSTADPVILVTGAYTDPAFAEEEKVHVVHNETWKEGIASSIRCGLTALLDIAPHIQSAIIMVCDQPFVTTAVLNGLITTGSNQNKAIVACSYKNTIGTPVLFKQEYFGKLAALQGDEGAKKFVLQHLDQVAAIPFPQGEIDIDTISDYENLQQGNAR